MIKHHGTKNDAMGETCVRLAWLTNIETSRNTALVHAVAEALFGGTAADAR